MNHRALPKPILTKSFLTPILLSLLGISSFALAILLYQYLVVKYCAQRRQLTPTGGPPGQLPPSRGVHKDVLKKIPILPYFLTEPKPRSLDRSECVVCLGQLEYGDMVRVLPACKHVFHVDCIDDWLIGHDNCPVCRAQVNNSSMATSLGDRQCGLKRSLSIDNSFLIVDIKREDKNGLSHSPSCSTKIDVRGCKLGDNGVAKSLDFVPSKLLRSLTRLRLGDDGMRKETLLPY